MDKINWRTWGDEAFQEAKKTDKPVLLGISAVWCHWCHVMDQTTYSDNAVISLVNDKYIPIRVDNDRDPDINARYNLGGWPTTAFLTSDRDVITGGTYIPPTRMTETLRRVAEVYKQEREDLVRQALETRARMRAELGPVAPGEASLDDVREVLEAVEASFDPTYGGFGTGQKFPLTPVLDLLLLNYERTGSRTHRDMIAVTLDNMLEGEIFDPVEGGMFRYATQRDWSVPHYEKMLEDNARIAIVLLDAYRLMSDQRYLDAARSVFGYLENVLMDSETGAFLGSQDADEEYYQRDAAGRAEMTPPKVDTAVYTDSNATTARAYLKLWDATCEEQARDRALRLVDFFDDLPRSPDGAVCHYYEDNQARGFGILSDQVCLALANVACHDATGEERYLSYAGDLFESARSAFGAGEGGLSDISKSRAKKRGLSLQLVPIDENSMAARLCLKLFELTGDPAYRPLAAGILHAQSGRYRAYGMMAAEYAIAVANLYA